MRTERSSKELRTSLELRSYQINQYAGNLKKYQSPLIYSLGNGEEVKGSHLTRFDKTSSGPEITPRSMQYQLKIMKWQCPIAPVLL